MFGAFPIGSIYLSVNSTSPASLFGGTWEKIKDKFLLASGDTYSAGATGGEATHTLTIEEMPSHSHVENEAGPNWSIQKLWCQAIRVRVRMKAIKLKVAI